VAATAGLLGLVLILLAVVAAVFGVDSWVAKAALLGTVLPVEFRIHNVFSLHHLMGTVQRQHGNKE
jgi:hypothetical protein